MKGQCTISYYINPQLNGVIHLQIFNMISVHVIIENEDARIGVAVTVDLVVPFDLALTVDLLRCRFENRTQQPPDVT